MPHAAMRVVDVYAYRFAMREGAEFLLLRRAEGVVYAGQWRMVGGKIQAGEAAWEAALRELHEETGAPPLQFWSVPSVNTFYEWQEDRINLVPAFAAELDDDPVLGHEHDAYAWLTAEEAVEELAWPEQQRLVQLVDQMLREGIPPELIVDL